MSNIALVLSVLSFICSCFTFVKVFLVEGALECAKEKWRKDHNIIKAHEYTLNRQINKISEIIEKHNKMLNLIKELEKHETN